MAPAPATSVDPWIAVVDPCMTTAKDNADDAADSVPSAPSILPITTADWPGIHWLRPRARNHIDVILANGDLYRGLFRLRAEIRLGDFDRSLRLNRRRSMPDSALSRGLSLHLGRRTLKWRNHLRRFRRFLQRNGTRGERELEILLQAFIHGCAGLRACCEKQRSSETSGSDNRTHMSSDSTNWRSTRAALAPGSP